MIKKIIVGLILLLGFASLGNAQTTNQLQWDVPVALTEYQTYTATVTIDNVVSKVAPTCVSGGAALTSCSLNIPALSTGTHTISIVNAKGTQTAGLVITGVDPSTGPKPAQNFRINITITITSGS